MYQSNFANKKAAGNLLWLAFLLYISTWIFGRAWDSYWHITYTFETFFSPPHLFIYAMTTLNIGVVAIMILVPDLQQWFGHTIKFRILNLPGSLTLVWLGFTILSFAGLILDNLWHSNFGLDETVWSFPHALIGWMWLMILLGFVACFIEYYRSQTLSQYLTLLLSVCIIGFSVSPILGPLFQKNTPAMVQAIAQLPVLAAQEGARHTHEIYYEWNLNRTNSLTIILGAYWAGLVLVFIQHVDKRARTMLAATFLWSLLTALGDWRTVHWLDIFLPVSNDPASWLPLPLLPAAITFQLLGKLNLNNNQAYLATGAIYGLFTLIFWHITNGVWIVASPLALLVGAKTGIWIYQTITESKPTKIGLLIAAFVLIPFILGCIDLYLRAAS